MATAPFPVDPVLTGITLAYKNRRYIADDVLPRLEPPLEKEEFQYMRMTAAEGFTIPDTKVGRKSLPNEIEFSGARLTDRTLDYGLDDLIPFNDMQNAPQGYDPRMFAAESLTDLILLDREKRVADSVFAAATYPTANKTTLSGSSQWSDITSNPIDAIMVALDVPLIRPTIGVFGRATFTKLAVHPNVVKATQPFAPDRGVARRQDIAELLELEEILIGESFVNTAKVGQTATYARVWGRHAAFLFRDRLARGDSGRITFGMTFQFGTRVAGDLEEPKSGLRGATRVRVGESVREVITASDVGYFFENAVA